MNKNQREEKTCGLDVEPKVASARWLETEENTKKTKRTVETTIGIIMKLNKTFLVAVGGLALSAVTSYAAMSLNFSSVAGSTIQFNQTANSFQFNGTAGTGGTTPQWQIGSESGVPLPSGSAVGLFGWVNNSPFSYGPITINGSDQSATVLGPLGALVIADGSSQLTGSVNWMTVSTSQTIGGVNAALAVNVTGLAYSGANVDLQRLVTEAGVYGGSMNISFQFSPGKTLTQLSQGNPDGVPFRTSYSGSISAVPEPTTMIAGALLLLPFGASTLRVLRKNRTA